MKLPLKRVLSAACLFLCIVFANAFADDAGSTFYPARVKDISDRAYEPAVIALLDGAKRSIVMSMYIVKAEDKGPVRLLLTDLEEALDRGVTVEIYINTRPGHGMPPSEEIDRLFEPIIAKGAKVYKVTPHYLLHDKLIVVDGRYIVVGSTNWSVAALKTNYEATVLIDSPEIAKSKTLRMRRFILEGTEPKHASVRKKAEGLTPLAKGAVVEVSKELLDNKKYFSAMLRRQADRTMDIYLLLLAESSRSGAKEFFISLEDLAVSSGVSPEWSDTAMRRQMIKELKALQDRYCLIDVNFSYGKDAWIELRDLPGGVFAVQGDFFEEKNLISKSQPVKFVSLAKLLLASEGASAGFVTAPALSERFGISHFSACKGLKE